MHARTYARCCVWPFEVTHKPIKTSRADTHMLDERLKVPGASENGRASAERFADPRSFQQPPHDHRGASPDMPLDDGRGREDSRGLKEIRAAAASALDIAPAARTRRRPANQINCSAPCLPMSRYAAISALLLALSFPSIRASLIGGSRSAA